MSWIDIAKKNLELSDEEFTDIITFIKNNVSKVNNNVITLYDKLLEMADTITEEVSPIPLLTAVLLDSGINPLQYMNSIPDSYGAALLDGKIELPSKIKYIGDCAFVYSDIEEIKISDGTIKVGDYAFYGCSKLKKVHLPKSIYKIGYNAFSSLNENVEIYYDGTEAEWRDVDIDGTSFTVGYNGNEYYNIHCLDKTIVAFE